ncbi:MAG: electron transport complex subunit RsxC [Hyphomicrobiales bacterium]|nr:MAG: electron transport complex subunit RsxC [Hyphomicrobiales bacterium]
MKLFSIRGGVHPSSHKSLSSEQPIRAIAMPELLHVPMRQNIGAPAEPVVAEGESVLKGQLIGESAGPVSAPVHAPTSGTVTAIGDYIAPHPSGLAGLTITIAPDGREAWAELPPPLDPETATGQEIADRVREAGIVGMGGAAFPSSVKLGLGTSRQLHSLILNGAECEPYLSADDRLMRERSEGIVGGAAIMMKALGIPRAIVAIEDNKPEAIAAMRAAASGHGAIEIAAVPSRYPMGSEKQLIQVVTGVEVPAGKLPAHAGVLVHNVATAHAVHDAVRFGRPLISRVVTVSGGAMAEPGNLEVLIGTPVADMISACGGLKGTPEQLLLGGPMMGVPLHDKAAPAIKGNNGVLALSRSEVNPGAHMPCIRCADCVAACPCGLQPLEMMIRIRNEKLSEAADVGLYDCILCGACSWVCPSHIPLVQYFNYARGALRDQDIVKQHQDKLKGYTQRREERLERIARAKEEARKARKAKMAAAKAAKAKAAAEEEATDA